MLQCAIAHCGSANDQRAICHGARNCLEFIGVLQHVSRTHRGTGFPKRKAVGIYQSQSTASEIRHGARSRSNVQRVAWTHQHDDETVQVSGKQGVNSRGIHNGKIPGRDVVARRTKVDFRGAFLALQIDFRTRFLHHLEVVKIMSKDPVWTHNERGVIVSCSSRVASDGPNFIGFRKPTPDRQPGKTLWGMLQLQLLLREEP